MASAAGNGDQIAALVDAHGRLLDADPMLAQLQQEAGANVGERLALPQLAAIARLVRKLGIAVARPALVAARDHDIELWVRGEPDGDDVRLVIESWRKRPAQGPRLELAARSDEVLPAAKGEWAADAELRFSELSPDLANLLGAGAAEAVGQPLTKWLRLLESDEGSMPLLTAVAARAPFTGQLVTGRNGHGNQKLVMSGNPVFGPDGAFAGFRGRAVPEEKAHPQAANEIGNASLGIDPALDHALRSPIARIIKAAEGIAGRNDGPLRSDYAEYAADIAAAAKHLLSVIRTMVDQPPEEESAVDLVALVHEAIALVETQAEEKEITLTVDGDETLNAVGEARAVVQILVNLLGNAVRHTTPGSTIAVSLVHGSEFASITVADQGKGIAPADQQRIFERFERGEGEGPGAGLGLAIARRLARSMQGDITLVSAPGQGARFTLSLPLV